MLTRILLRNDRYRMRGEKGNQASIFRAEQVSGTRTPVFIGSSDMELLGMRRSSSPEDERGGQLLSILFARTF
jgi:hypothetical protein